MRIARWIGMGALAAGLAMGWAKHFVRGQSGVPGTPTSAPAPAAPPRPSVDSAQLQPQLPMRGQQYQLPPLPGGTSAPVARSAPVTPAAPGAPTTTTAPT